MISGNKLKIISNALNHSAGIFSIGALMLLLAFPFIVSDAINKQSSVADSQSPDSYSAVPRVVMIDSSGVSNLAQQDSSDNRNVLGVQDQNLKNVSAHVETNPDLFKAFGKVNQLLTTDRFNLTIEHSGDVAKVRLFTISNNSTRISKYNISVRYEASGNEKNPNNVVRNLYIDDLRYSIASAEVPTSITLLPGHRREVFIELSKTATTVYRFELTIVE